MGLQASLYFIKVIRLVHILEASYCSLFPSEVTKIVRRWLHLAVNKTLPTCLSKIEPSSLIKYARCVCRIRNSHILASLRLALHVNFIIVRAYEYNSGNLYVMALCCIHTWCDRKMRRCGSRNFSCPRQKNRFYDSVPVVVNDHAQKCFRFHLP